VFGAERHYLVLFHAFHQQQVLGSARAASAKLYLIRALLARG
jgi:hypothetical protein